MPVTLCSLLKRACEKNGLEVYEGEHGVGAIMANGMRVCVFRFPRTFSGPCRSWQVYGATYRRGDILRYMDGAAAKALYDKLRDAVGNE